MSFQTKLKYNLLRILGHQGCIRYGIRNRILRYFCNPETVNSYDFSIDFFGLKYKGNLNCYIDWNIYFYGSYEKQILLLLRDLVKNKEKPIFLDIGANVGNHSLFMSNYCDQIHAFEPYEPVISQLKLNIKNNDIDNITIHNIGLGRRSEELDFYAPIGVNTATGSFLSSHNPKNNRKFKRIRVEEGDSYIQNLNLPKIDLIKLDAEDSESNILIGLKNTLFQYLPVITVEFKGELQKEFDTVNKLLGLFPRGYKAKEIIINKHFLAVFGCLKYELLDFESTSFSGNLVLIPPD